MNTSGLSLHLEHIVTKRDTLEIYCVITPALDDHNIRLGIYLDKQSEIYEGVRLCNALYTNVKIL